MFCKNCEKPFNDGYKFCPNCGQKSNDKLTIAVLFNNTINNFFIFIYFILNLFIFYEYVIKNNKKFHIPFFIVYVLMCWTHYFSFVVLFSIFWSELNKREIKLPLLLELLVSLPATPLL